MENANFNQVLDGCDDFLEGEPSRVVNLKLVDKIKDEAERKGVVQITLFDDLG